MSTSEIISLVVLILACQWAARSWWRYKQEYQALRAEVFAHYDKLAEVGRVSRAEERKLRRLGW